VKRAERAALAWAVKRAAENTCILLGGMPQQNAVYAANKKAYDAKVKLARSCLRKMRYLCKELKGNWP
jgi:hypothetical protein